MKRPIPCRLILGAAAALAAALLPLHAQASPGDLYVADSATRSILRFGPDGTKSTFVSDLLQPLALAFDRKGNLFVADADSCVSSNGNPCEFPSKILRFTSAGERSIFVTLAPNTQVLGMAFDGAGNLFVAANGRILKFAPDGTQTAFPSSARSVWPLAFGRLGQLYAGVNPVGPGSIVKIAPDGSSSTFVTLPTSNSATGLAFDAAGNLFVKYGSAILRITPAGSISTFATGNFTYPLAFDGQGNLFAALNAYNASEPAIVKFTDSGTSTTFSLGPMSPSAFAFEPVTEKLRNISARGFVQTGDNVLIGGFIVGGNALANNAVVARAIGPSLSQAGVAQPLLDPILELRDASGALIIRNDNWQDTQEREITATGLAPTHPRESAILATLPAGAYTAIVRGVDNSTGLALVEIFSLHQN